MKSRWLLAILPFVLIVLASPASADEVYYDMPWEYSGAQQPDGKLIAIFDDGGTAGSVTLTLDASNLVGTEFVNDWMFNIDPNVDLSSLNFNVVSSSAGPFDINVGANAFSAGPDGQYDLWFDFKEGPPSVRFKDGKVVIEITGDGITAESFDYLSDPGKKGPYPTAAHIGGVGPDGEGSGWVTIPEPGSFMLALFGLSGAGFLCWRRRRES